MLIYICPTTPLYFIVALDLFISLGCVFNFKEICTCKFAIVSQRSRKTKYYRRKCLDKAINLPNWYLVSYVTTTAISVFISISKFPYFLSMSTSATTSGARNRVSQKWLSVEATSTNMRSLSNVKDYIPKISHIFGIYAIVSALETSKGGLFNRLRKSHKNTEISA